MKTGEVSLREDFHQRSRRAMMGIVFIVATFALIAAALLTWRAGSSLCELSRARLENEAPALAKELMIGSRSQVNTLLELARVKYPKEFSFDVSQERTSATSFRCDWSPFAVTFQMPLTFAGESLGVLLGSAAIAPWWSWALGILAFAIVIVSVMWRLTASYYSHFVANVIDPISQLANSSRHGQPGFESLDALQNVRNSEDSGSNLNAFVLYREVDFVRNAIIQWKRSAQYEAVASTTQALAHDVRKPFSMIKMIIQAIETTDDVQQVQEILNAAIPEINQAMAGVEGMIQDVMQIGSNAKPMTEDASPASLAEAALVEIFRVEQSADVSIESHFNHSTLVSVDTVRIGRVFSNIIGNALQAMKKRGNIWIHTNQRGAFVEFIIGNSGSYIAEENLEKIFDSFFTSGKKDGTGLGLAIARRIVELHGGKIACRSMRARGEGTSDQVEFIFTLPASTTPAGERSEHFPQSAQEIRDGLALSRVVNPSLSASLPEEELENEIQRSRANSSSPFVILIVDDEAIYRNGLRSLLERSKTLKELIQLEFATDDVSALQTASRVKPALIIQDIDLGKSEINGIDIVKSLRQLGFQGKICIHSNRFLTEDTRVAIEAGADMVLPKPVSRAQFLKLILASCV